jgi:leucyl-tRNA synthetase
LSYYKHLLQMLAPFAPFITEEIWAIWATKHRSTLSHGRTYNPAKISPRSATIVVQVNGKVRGEFKAWQGISEAEARDKAVSMPEIKKWTEGKEIVKVIFVPGKLVNIVVKIKLKTTDLTSCHNNDKY